MKTKSVIRSLPLIALASALLSQTAAAQQAVSYSFDDDFILDEIIVTAQKRSQNVQDVPVSVSVYSQQELEYSNVTNFSDLNRLTAGLSVVDIGNGLGSTVRLRGVGQEPFGLTLQPSVAIIIDGVAQPRLDTAFASFMDIERVEVLRGPQGTLWGRNAPAGAITIKTTDVDTESVEGSLEALLGTYRTERYVGTVNLPIVEDVLAARITGFLDQQDGFIEFNHSANQTNWSDRDGGRFKLRYEPTDNLVFDLSYEVANIDARPTRVRNSYGSNIIARAALAGTTLAPVDAFTNRSNIDQLSNFRSNTETTSLRSNWQIDDNYNLNLLSAYQEFKDKLTGEVDSSSIDLFNVTHANNFDHNFSHELQLTFDGEDLSYIVGAYYSEVHQRGPTLLNAGSDGLNINNASVLGFTDYGSGGGAADFFAALAALGTVPPTLSPATNELTGLLKFVLVPDINLENQYDTYVRALFGHFSYSLAEQWTVDAGLRYSSEKVSSRNMGTTTYSIPALFTTIPGGDAVDFNDSKTFDSVTGNAKFTFAMSDSVSLYAGIDYGYKAGGFNGAASPDISSNPVTREFDEETTLNYEFGWKSELMDKRLRANGAIFYQTYDDYQVQLPEATTGTNIISNADVISRGIESDIVYLATKALTLSATVSYIDAYYDDYQDAACTQPQIAAAAAQPFGNFAVCTQDLSDTRLNLSSRWNSNISALYQGKSLRVANTEANWFAFTEAVFRDDFVGDPSGNSETKTSSYTLLNAKIGLHNDAWEAEAWIKNIFDEEYFVSLEESSFADGTTGIQGDRRSAGVRFKLFFK